MSTLTKLTSRRNSTPKTTSSHREHASDVMAFRAANGEVQYAAAPPSAALQQQQASDSDGEPLIPDSTRHNIQPLDDDALQRFTATGKPMGTFKQSSLQTWSGDMYSVPQYLPKQYTDDSIIPAIITGIVPSPKQEDETGERKRKGSFVSKMFGKEKKDEGEKGITKVVFMPRREYIKWFAKDEKGAYCGTEPLRKWTEKELDDEFGQYKPDTSKTNKGGLGLLGRVK